MGQKISKLHDFYKRTYGEFTQQEIFDIVSEFDTPKRRYLKITPEQKITANIGKIFTDDYERGSKIYDDNMVLFSLGYLFKHTEPGHQVIIKDFTCLGKYANGPKDIEKCMSHDEREKYVMTMVKKHFPERQKDVVIIDVEQEAGDKELFASLKEKGIGGLREKECPKLSSEFTSLDIAKYLYRVTENNKKFKKWIYETIPEPKRGQGIIKTDENYPEYYGLLEIACRLYDLLKGERFQGGALRQYKYDKIIKTIIGKEGYISKMKELAPLQEFCKNILSGSDDFDVFYIDEEKYKNNVRSKGRQKEKAKTITRRALRTILGALGVFGMGKTVYDTMKSHNREVNMENSREVLADVLEANGVDSAKVAQVMEKIETVDCENIYDRMKDHYRTGGISSEQYKEWILRTRVRNYKWLQKVSQDIPSEISSKDSANRIIDRFLAEKFYPSKSYEIAKAGGDILPFEDLVGEDRFQNRSQAMIDFTNGFTENVECTWTLGINSQLVSLSENSEEISRKRGIAMIYTESPFFNSLGVYEVNGKRYEIGTITITGQNPNEKQSDPKDDKVSYSFFVATPFISKAVPQKIFSTNLAKKVLGEIITIRENAQGYIDNPEAQYTKQVKPDTTSSHVDVYRSPEKPKKDTTNFSEKYKPGAKYGYSGIRQK